MKKGSFIISFIAFLSIWGCSPDANNKGHIATSTTPVPEKPVLRVTKEDGYKVARGATRIQDMNTIYDTGTKGMKLKGKIEYIPVNGDRVRDLDIDVAGVLDSNGTIALKTAGQGSFKNGEQVVAKATCLGEDGSCADSFIDIYLYVDGIVYHHQIESHQDVKQNEDKTEIEDLERQTKEMQKPSPITGEEELETEGDSDMAGDSGQYIGSLKEDIETLLKIKPEEPEVPKKEGIENGSKPEQAEPAGDKKEEVKKEQNKKEEPAKVDSKQEKIKKDEPKRLEPKKEKVKKDEAKRVESKKEDIKKEVPKKVEPRKEEVKKEETKKEVTKYEDSKKQEPKKLQPPKEQPKKTEPKKEPHSHEIKKPQSAIQAIGPVNAGRLQNAADFYTYEKINNPTGYHIIRPGRKTYYATNEMLYIIAQMGQITKQYVPGQVLSVGDLSYKKGGQLGTHRSHKNGLDADVAYYFNNKSFQGFFAAAVVINKPHPNWMVEEQWKLFKYIVSTQYVDRIFVHKVIKNTLCNLAIRNGELKKGKNEGLAYETLRRLILDPEFHHNHFHLRVKCSKAQRLCKQMAEPAQGSGCF